MADNYFDFICQNAGEEKIEAPQKTQAMANVTVRADADCFLLCDGEYLDIQLEAGKMTKIQVPVGQHLLEFLYTEDTDSKVEKEVDFPEAGKSYLVIIKDLKAAVDNAAADAKAKEEAKRKAEEEAKRQAEEEAKRKALMQIDFIQKYLVLNWDGHFKFKHNFTDNEIQKLIDEEIRPAADFGNASAQCFLGKCYIFGRGVTKDQTEAVKWCRKAAERGNVDAQVDLGLMYEDGWMGEEGYLITEDEAEAMKWYRKAAERGNARAQFHVGLIYAGGFGVPVEFVEAVKWFRKAAEQGYVPAQYELGWTYYYGGYGVTKDYAEAKKWLMKAAEPELEDAQYIPGCIFYKGGGFEDSWYLLGKIYYEGGHGLTQDYAEAKKWLQKAAEKGNSDAGKALKEWEF